MRASASWREHHAKVVRSGLVLTGVAALYLSGLRGIAETTLSDDVGPRGIPLLLGVALAVTGLLIAGAGCSPPARRRAAAVTTAVVRGRARAPFWRVAVLLGLGGGFIALAWLAGYIVAGNRPAGCVAAFEGRP